MDWTILGIEPTDDKKAITAAYRAKLKTTNPEEKPEQFKALRAAYEEALRLADQEQAAPVRDESPVGRWMERVSAVYNTFPQRINADCWRDLLDDDVCAGLDTRPRAEEALMKFLMEHYILPNAVWKALDEALSFQERAEELCEVYPRDFIEQCVLIGIRYEQGLHLDLFEPGRNAQACDAYRDLYYQCYHAAPEERADLLDRMESLPEQHPYGRALRCLWLLDNGREEEGKAGFLELARKFPDDPRLTLDHANLCIRCGEADEAEAIARHILSLNPIHTYARRTLAEAQAAKGQLAEAKETLYDIMHDSGDDPVLMEQLSERIREWNTELISRYEAALATDPADSNSAVELAWCHLQGECPDQAMEVALKIDPESADPFDYNNLMGKLYHNIEMFDKAAEHMAAVVDLLRSTEPDGTEKTAKRLRRLPEMLQIQGNSLLQSGETERGKSVLAEAMSLAPDDPKILSLMANIHYAAGEYDRCIDVMTHLTEVNPASWFGYLMLGICFYKLRRDREAFDAVNRAMSIHGSDLSIYVLRMQILLRNGVFEEVRDTLTYLREEGAPEDIALDFIRAQLLELEDKDEQAAFRAYQAIARRVEEGETLMDAPLLYYQMANIMGRQSKGNKRDDYELLLSVLDKGLSHDPNDADCLDYKAWLLQRLGKLDEAIAMYRKLTTPQARRRLADLYFEELNTYGAEALTIYEELLAQRQTPELCFYAAASAKSLGDFDKTERYCNLALSLDPGDIDAHRILGHLLEACGDNAGSLEHLDRAIESMWENELFYDWLIGHKVKVLRRMGRHAEALALIDDAMSRAEYSGYDLKFEICCQFGLWNQAEAVLAQWAAAEQGNPEVTKSTGRLHLLRGKMLKATFAYAKVKHQMDVDEEVDLRIQLADLEANNKRLTQLWGQRAENYDDRVNALMNYAFALRQGGNAEKARQLAEEAIGIVDETLKTYHTNETLHRTRRSLLLMLAGREAEARSELALARTKPLCQHCTYCSCKDADIFEAFLEELAGNYAKAKQLYQDGQKNWPDELDFVSGETRMKKKKGK